MKLIVKTGYGIFTHSRAIALRGILPLDYLYFLFSWNIGKINPFKYHILSYLSLLTTCYLLLTTVVCAEPPKRIISLAPSMTEILFALDLGDRIVAVTSYCDYPEEAKKKPKIGGMSNPSLEAVVSLKPDIVVMTTDGNPKEFEERLRQLKIKTYVFRARRIIELSQGIRELGSALGVKERADAMANEIETAISKFKILAPASRSPRRVARGDPRRQNSNPPLPPFAKGGRGGIITKKVLFIVWPEPLIVAGRGTAIDDAITMLGYKNIASEAKTSYPKYSIEEVMRQSPDVIFIGRVMGQDISEVSKEFLKKMAMVSAVKNGKVFYVSDSLYRLGPRVIDGIEEIKKCLR